jgi:hypothetical protein
MQVEAGTTDLDHTGRNVTFGDSFATQPAVFSTTQTENGRQTIVTRQEDVSTAGFDCRLQEEEALGSHVTETVGYLAVERGNTTADGVALEAGRTPNAVTDSPSTIDFAGSYDTPPVVLAAAQTADGPDTAMIRRTALDETGIEVAIEEGRSADAETNHTTEAVGYFAVGGDRLVGN